MRTGALIGITLGVVVVCTALWLADDRLSRRPGYRRKMQFWAGRLGERRRKRGFRRPTFVVWIVTGGVVLIALLFAAR